MNQARALPIGCRIRKLFGHFAQFLQLPLTNFRFSVFNKDDPHRASAATSARLTLIRFNQAQRRHYRKLQGGNPARQIEIRRRLKSVRQLRLVR
jgi:hypothetical protein